MNTERLDSLIAEGTHHTFRPVLLHDGHALSVCIERGSDTVATVCLWLGLDAPDGEAWEKEDHHEAFLTGDDTSGRDFLDVPVRDLRSLIEQHGGEAPATDTEDAAAYPTAHLRAAGVRYLEDGGRGGRYLRVPLADGTTVTFAGTTIRPDRNPDVSIHHPVREHLSWSAQWSDGATVFADVYDSHDTARPYVDDTAALMHAVCKRVRQSGGSAPEGGPGPTAEEFARKALAEWGLTAHLDEESGCTWLVIGHPDTGHVPDMDKEPHILLSVYNEDDDEWSVDRPPARPGDHWQVVTDDGTGTEETLTIRPANQLAPCITTIADWITQPRT